MVLNIGSCGYWAEEARKFAVRICLRKWRGGSPASAQRLSLGLERNAPRASLRDEAWTVSRRVREDLEARLNIGEP